MEMLKYERERGIVLSQVEVFLQPNPRDSKYFLKTEKHLPTPPPLGVVWGLSGQ